MMNRARFTTTPLAGAPVGPDAAEWAAGASARLVAETVPVGLAAVDMRGRPVYANAALARTLGYDSVQDLLRTPIHRLHAHPSLALDILRDRMEDGALEGLEMELLRKDGGTVQVRIHARPLRMEAARRTSARNRLPPRAVNLLAW